MCSTNDGGAGLDRMRNKSLPHTVACGFMWTETIMSSHELHLTYFTLRARGEPVLLLLVDSGITFTLEEVSPETWVQWRRSGKVTRDDYPYSALPVLRVRDKSALGKDFVLAETSAILSFLEEFLAPRGTPVGDADGVERKQAKRDHSFSKICVSRLG